jgi:ApaG protein
MLAYVATTDEIRVSVRPVYLDGQSDILGGRFVFAYFIRIENRGSADVQLLRRHWFITNGVGNIEEVEGEGVIGEQPVISPDGVHEYNSYTVIDSFEGFMYGTYLMERADGQRFRVEIPKFDLRAAAN